MTTDCHRLDAYLEDRLTADQADAFETHVLECQACDNALALPGLSALRTVTCPPDVLEAALRSAKRAPDRALSRTSPTARRWVWASIATAAACAVALIALLRPVDQNLVADATPEPTIESTAPVLEDEAVTPDDSSAAPLTTEEDVLEVASAPRPSPSPSRTRPRPRVSPRPQAPARTVSPTRETTPDLEVAQAIPDPSSTTLDDPDLEDAPTDAEIAQARQDIALAFELVANVQDRARDAIQSEAGPVASTLNQTLPF